MLVIDVWAVFLRFLVSQPIMRAHTWQEPKTMERRCKKKTNRVFEHPFVVPDLTGGQWQDRSEHGVLILGSTVSLGFGLALMFA